MARTGLKRREVTVLLNQGLDTEIDEKSVPLGRLTRAENVYFDRRGAMFKRPGTTELSTRVLGPGYAQVSGAQGLAARAEGTDLNMLTTDDRLLSFEDPDGWRQMGTWVNVRTDLLPLPVRPWESVDASMATIGDRRLVVWQDLRGGVYGQLMATDGRALTRDFLVSLGSTTACRPSVVAVGATFLVCYTDGADLYSAPVGFGTDVATPVVGQVQLLTSLSGSGVGVGSQQLYDLAPFDSDVALLGVAVSGTAPTLAFLKANGFTAQSGSFPFHPSPVAGFGPPNGFGPVVCPTVDLSHVGYLWALSTGPTLLHLNVYRTDTLSSVAGLPVDVAYPGEPIVRATVVNDPISPPGSWTYLWAAEHSSSVLPLANGPTNNYIKWGSITMDATGSVWTQSTGTLLQHAHLSSRAFTVGTDSYVWTTHESPDQSTNFCVRLTDGHIVARRCQVIREGAPDCARADDGDAAWKSPCCRI